MTDATLDPEDPSTWPKDYWRSGMVAAQLSHEFGDHVIAIGIAFTFDKQAHYEWFSGFLVVIDDRLLWLTAGHVVDRILELRDSQAVRIDYVSWNDNYPDAAAAEVPFPLQALAAYKDTEMDFGAVLIRPCFADPLLANPNVRPMTPEFWYGHTDAKPEGYYVVGFAERFCNFRLIGREGPRENYTAAAHLLCLPMEPIDRPSSPEPADFWDDPHALYGQLVPFKEGVSPENQSSIKGMSGGPVLSIEREGDGRLLKRLFGIQSAWLPESRIVRAVSIGSAVKAMVKWLQAIHP